MSEDDPSKRAWAYFQHADNTATGRIDFFVVGQAILVEAATHIEAGEVFLRTAVGFLALIYALSWFYVNERLGRRMRHLAETHLEKDPIYKEYVESAGGVSSRVVLHFVVPLSTVVFWLTFLGFAWSAV